MDSDPGNKKSGPFIDINYAKNRKELNRIIKKVRNQLSRYDWRQKPPVIEKAEKAQVVEKPEAVAEIELDKSNCTFYKMDSFDFFCDPHYDTKEFEAEVSKYRRNFQRAESFSSIERYQIDKFLGFIEGYDPFEEYKRENNVQIDSLNALFAGWVPMGNIKTWADFCKHQISNNVNVDIHHKILYQNVLKSLECLEKSEIDPKKWFNIVDYVGIDNSLISSLCTIAQHKNHINLNKNSQNNKNTAFDSVYTVFNCDNSSMSSSMTSGENLNIFEGILSNYTYYTNEFNVKIQHSFPAQYLQKSMFPVRFSRSALKYYHKSRRSDLFLCNGYTPILSVQGYAESSVEETVKFKTAQSCTDNHFVMSVDNITCLDQQVFLFEYSEEFPFVVNNLGMNSKLFLFINENFLNEKNKSFELNRDKKNIKEKLFGKTYSNFNFVVVKKYDDAIYDRLVNIVNGHSPFPVNFNKLLQKENICCVPAIENNMFRACVAEHTLNKTDFLVVKTSEGYFIRKVNKIFTVGQLHPKTAVPNMNNTKESGKFHNNMVNYLINKMFMRNVNMNSAEGGRKIKAAEVRHLFRFFNENLVRKKLKKLCDYERRIDRKSSELNLVNVGTDPGEYTINSSFYVLKKNVVLPSVEQLIMQYCKPEEACLYYSMVFFRWRLQNLGYLIDNAEENLKTKMKIFYNEKEKSVDMNSDDDETDNHNPFVMSKKDNEMMACPWNLADNYMNCFYKSKYILKVQEKKYDYTGDRGCGLSFIRDKQIPNNYTRASVNTNNVSFVTATNVVKRSNKNNNSVNVKMVKKFLMEQNLVVLGLKSFDEINTKSKEELFSLLKSRNLMGKFLQSDYNVNNTDGSGMNLDKIVDKRGKKKIQQGKNKDVGNNNVQLKKVELADENDIKNFKKNCDEIFVKNLRYINETSIKSDDLSTKLEKYFDNMVKTMDDNSTKNNHKTDETNEKKDVFKIFTSSKKIPKKLVIKRVFYANGENESNKIVQDYSGINVHTNKYERTQVITDKNVILSYLKTVKANPRLHKKITNFNDVLKKKNITHNYNNFHNSNNNVITGVNFNFDLDKNCIYINEPLMNRANNEIKLFVQRQFPHLIDQKKKVADTNNHTTHVNNSTNTNEMLFYHDNLAEETVEEHAQLKNLTITDRQIALLNEIYEDGMCSQRSANLLHISRQRKRADPLITLNLIFNEIISKVRTNPSFEPFLQPINPKKVFDYYRIIKNPMDLMTVKNMAQESQFTNRKDFISAVELIESNCVMYNGKLSNLSERAANLVKACREEVNFHDEHIFACEKEINPMLDEDPIVPLNWILENLIEKVKSYDGTWPFHEPVNLKLFPNYTEFVSNPSDLGTVKSRCANRLYNTLDEFKQDIDQIYHNSVLFNGQDHSVTKMAEHVVSLVEKEIVNFETTLLDLETKINQQPSTLKNYYQKVREKNFNDKKRKRAKKDKNKNNLNNLNNYEELLNIESSDEDLQVLRDMDMSE